MQRSLKRNAGEASNAKPFGLDLSMATFDRITRLAQSLFRAAGASVILVHEGQVWRSRYAGVLPTEDPVSKAVLNSGEAFWVEDGLVDTRVSDHPLVTGPPYLRFSAAAPIRLQDGSMPGVLSVSGLRPHRYNAQKAARLKDLADILADEWSRAQSVRERDAAFERSERSEQRLTLALELADVHVWELDYKNRKLFKAGAEDSFFYEPQTYERLWRDVRVTIDPRDRPAVALAWADHIENGAPYRPEYRIDRADGREVWVKGSIRLLTDAEGQPERMVGALENITARKQNEEALRRAKEAAEAADRAKSEFLATMSHEIRTPLNGVLGMVQVMRRGVLTAEQREAVNVIADSGQSLLSVLNGVLDLSKIESGALELEIHRFDLLETVKLAAAPYGPLAAQKEIEFRVDVAAAARGVWRGDSAKLRQVISNLLSNALKFTAEGSITLRVICAGEGLRFEVEDTGLGIPRDKHALIFERFTQADASTTRRFGGTGLGLAICHRLVSLMGGELTLDSREGVGSTFAFTAPIEPDARAGPLSPAEDQNIAFDPDRALRILAAEDNPTNQLILSALLAPLGAELTLVGDGREAVAAFEAGRFDLVLMDVQMPRMDGVQATAEIRRIERSAGRVRTPVIALTANVMHHQTDAYLAAGMDGFVAKPIELSALAGAIETALADVHTDAVSAA